MLRRLCKDCVYPEEIYMTAHVCVLMDIHWYIPLKRLDSLGFQYQVELRLNAKMY